MQAILSYQQEKPSSEIVFDMLWWVLKFLLLLFLECI
jgi:hypothetical protein